MGAMGYAEYVMFFIFCALVVLLSFILDHMWSRILPNRIVHRIFVTPGIIVHECSHALACVLTGAKIEEIKFFDPEGGHVTHGKSKVPVLGQVLISLAPMFGIPLFLFLMAFIFGLLEIIAPFSFPHITSVGSFFQFIVVAFVILWDNVIGFYWWFILFLYLSFSFVVCLAPSGKDFRNSLIGIAVIFVLGLVFLVLVNVIEANTSLEWGTPVMKFIIKWLYYAVGIGFVVEVIALMLTIPLYAIVWMIRRRA